MIGLPLYFYIAISITGIFSLTPKQLIEILIMAAASETVWHQPRHQEGQAPRQE